MSRILTVMMILSFYSCGNDPVPKPHGELRLGFPTKSYGSVELDCPFSFEKPDYSIISQAEGAQARCWKNLNFPQNKATIYLTYTPINGNLKELLEDTRDLTYEHHIKASNIESELVIRPEADVYGLVYEVSGDVASTAQFYLTDSTRHFVRGSLYFNVKPNWDSLQPASEFIQRDIDHLIQTFRWQD